jgi:hypothetical protein
MSHWLALLLGVFAMLARTWRLSVNLRVSAELEWRTLDGFVMQCGYGSVS